MHAIKAAALIEALAAVLLIGLMLSAIIQVEHKSSKNELEIYHKWRLAITNPVIAKGNCINESANLNLTLVKCTLGNDSQKYIRED